MRAAWLGLLLPLSALADAVLVDRGAATVDLHVITRSGVEARVRPRLAAAKSPEARAQLPREALQQLIEGRLIAEDADRPHVRIASEEIDRALEAVATQNGLAVAQPTREVVTSSRCRSSGRPRATAASRAAPPPAAPTPRAAPRR